MDTVYLDTFVYNKLIDNRNIRDQILSLKNNNQIEIIFSEYLFNELVSTWKENEAQAQTRCIELFKCVLELISDKILKQRESIINEEINIFLCNKRGQNVFFKQEQRDSMLKTMKRLSSGERITNIEPLRGIMARKKINHNKIKKIIKKHEPKKNIGIQNYASFDEFYSSVEIKEEENEFIKEFLLDKIIKKPDNMLIEKVKANIHNLLYFKSYLRMTSAYQYSFLIYKKPLRGDDYDLRHFVCASGIDILVSDSDFIDILRWTYPEKNCFTLAEFIRHFNLQD